MHTVTVDELQVELNTEIEIATASKPKAQKILTYNPYLGRYTMVFAGIPAEHSSYTYCFKEIQQAVDFYNTINI